MTQRDFLTKWLIYGLALLPVWFLEIYVLSRISIFGVSPTLLPLAAITVAVLEGGASGAGFGLAVGVICDAVYGTNGAMTLSLTACTQSTGGDTGGAGNTQQQSGGTTYNVAVVKQMDHASLDEIANAITARLDEIAAEQGITIDYGQVYSGQGDETILNQIGAQVVADGVDVIIPVATTAAQLMTVAAEGTGIPVVYAAVSDPEQADLLDLDYVTGMSDALNTQFILDMMLAQDPEVQTVGLLYSLSEPNSTKPIAEAKEYLDGKGIAYKEYTANSVDEVIAAAGTLIADGVDAVFTPTDNKIMEAELAIAPELAEAGIPHYTGADSFVRNGAFTTCGVNYTDLGTQTADLAYQVASEGMDGMEDYYLVEGGIITVNTETAQTLGADYSMFSDMGQVVEVATTED